MNIPDPATKNIWYRKGAKDSPAIIFVHGRASNVAECWTNNENSFPIYWPRLVTTEPSLTAWGVFLVGYHANDGSGTGIPGCVDEVYQALNDDPEAPLDRETIVFVTHSLGGIVVRKLLVDYVERFTARKVFLFLLASPSTGASLPKPVARMALSVAGLFRDMTLSKQLTVDRDLILDLDRQFRRLLDPNSGRFLPNLQGAERSETSYIKGIPILGRLVEHFASQHYFPEPKQLGQVDHSTISKPRNRNAPVHALLVERCNTLVPDTTPVAPAPDKLNRLTTALESDFGFRYEPAAGQPQNGLSVYWPVSLRAPTPIHAQQSFVAGALSKLGFEVQLWIDDLGNVEYGAELMIQRLRQWYGSVGGVADQLTVKLFKSVLEDEAARREAWQLSQKWLGDTGQDLQHVLRLSKLLPRSPEEPISLEKLLERRPRRLLTPPLVWLGLRLMGRGKGPVITLGGEDEINLWHDWRAQGVDSGLTAGHLYGAKLSVRKGGYRGDLHMKFNKIAWSSVQDIHSTLQEMPDDGQSLDRDTLRVWAVEQCVFLPQHCAGGFPEIASSHSTESFRTVEELWNLAAADRDRLIVKALQERLL